MGSRIKDAWRSFREDGGVAAVEAALVITIVVLPLFIGTVEFGFAFNQWLGVSSATREGARVGSAAGDREDADCVILEATAASLHTMDRSHIQEVWIYESDELGAVGAKQVYRPALDTDDPGTLYCSTWYPVETSWPSESRDALSVDRDWLGVAITFDHQWVTGAGWFNGTVTWRDTTVMRVEPRIG